VIDPVDGTLFAKATQEGTMLDSDVVDKIAKSSVYQVKVRSVLTCEASHGVCAKCYGINLSNNRESKIGDAIGIVAAQSIGEPGTQLTLRTFHIGGTASRIVEKSQIIAKRDGIVKFSDNLTLIETTNDEGEKIKVAPVRNSKIDLVDDSGQVITNWTVPYGSQVFVKDGEKVGANQRLLAWDPYTDVILARTSGKVVFADMIGGETYVEEAVQDGKKMFVITESKDRNLSPHIEIKSDDGETFGGASILPIKATVIVRDNEKVKAGQVLVKIPRDTGKTRDITGGLPRIAELFEARNPSNPSVVTEIDGVVEYGKVKRGVREITVVGKEGKKTYKIPYGKHILVHEADYIFAGDRLCDGGVSPKDILKIRGASRVQEYLVNAIQEVYRLQGVAINDKHIEVIVRQMMQKVTIEDSGDTKFLSGDRINRFIFKNENIDILKKVVITNPGDSDYEEGDIVLATNVKEFNKELKEDSKKQIKSVKAKPATSSPLLLGITRASLNTESFISAASFQETTRVLTDAAVEGKTDYLKGLKENVIIGRLIPAGTGAYQNRGLLVKNPTEIAKQAAEEEASALAEVEEEIAE
jgi:DNA-directed RNA polymerase subunit beta'